MTKLMIAAALIAAPAIAQTSPSPMAAAFGNTIVSTAPGGVVTKTHVNPDGTYKSETNGAVMSGTWEVRKGLICYSQTVPAPAAPLCTMGAKKKVGSKWSIVHEDDTSTKVTIVAGRS